MAGSTSFCYQPFKLRRADLDRYYKCNLPYFPFCFNFSHCTGFFSDFTKNLYKMPRAYSLVLVAFTYLISQIIAVNISNISSLWIASAFLGLAHGSISALIPTVCLEWFGLREFPYFLILCYTKLTECNYQLIFLRTGDM